MRIFVKQDVEDGQEHERENCRSYEPSYND